MNDAAHSRILDAPGAGWPAAATPSAPAANGGTGLSREQTRACSRQLASGVSVITTCDVDAQLYGLTMSAVLCVSLEPSLFLVSIADTSETLAPLLRRGEFVINILAVEQEAVAETFAAKGRDKFRRVAYALSHATRLPILLGALASIECGLVAAYPAGGHRLVVGHASAMHVRAGSPLLRYDGSYRSVECREHIAGEAR